MVVIFWLAVLITLAVVFYMEWWPNHVFDKVTIERKLEHMSVHAGEEVGLTMRFKNKKWLPINWLEVSAIYPSSVRVIPEGSDFNDEDESLMASREKLIDNTIHRLLLSLRSFYGLEERYKMRFTKRGRYYHHDVAVKTGDLFGMQVKYEELPCPMEIFVYPKLYPLDQLTMNNKTFMGEVVVKRWIIDDPLLISGVRDYTLGDPMKSIHWNATARTGNLQVRKNLYTADLAAIVVLNVKTKHQFVEGADAALLERLIEVAAAAVVQMDKNKVPVGLAVNCPLTSDIGAVMIQPGLGNAQYHRVFCALAQVGSYVSQAPEALMGYLSRNSHHNERLILVTAILSPEILESVRQAVLKGHDVEVITLAEALEECPGIHKYATVKVIREEAAPHAI